ncbi:PilZ domain-containing protein [Sphingorhabdus sp.]|uniref:PilZ domain-containing protein n=1 Tax=Sphingorhabdus sp. TaxID=1902408 RepID=UPI00391AB0FC
MVHATSQFRRVPPARLEQREAVRHAVLLSKVTVRKHTRRPATAYLVDLSVYGCRVLFDGSVKVGDRLWVRLAGSEPIGATAVWSDGERLGCKFDDTLDRSLFRALTLQAG